MPTRPSLLAILPQSIPRGSSMDYNYATPSVFPSGIEMKAEGTWDAPVRELSVKEISTT
ncbi:MAG: hypothetical protein IPG18_15390 [Saprospiraceae bacterium]|nr:hypothetical protein [Saprospiraceae bacterium]